MPEYFNLRVQRLRGATLLSGRRCTQESPESLARFYVLTNSTIPTMQNEAVTEEPLLLSLDHAAQRLSVSRRTLEREIAHGRFPRPLKIGRATRVSFRALQDYIRKLSGELSPA